MTAKKKRALRLCVGGVYALADGRIAHCEKTVMGDPSAFLCFTTQGHALGVFERNGTSRVGPGLNLIREVSAPKPTRKRKTAKAVRAFYLWFPVTEDGEFEFWNAGKTKSEARPSSPGMAVVRARVEVRR